MAANGNQNVSSTPPTESDAANSFLEGWREALAEVLDTERRKWQRERALIEAQAASVVASLRADVIERLAKLKDGERGEPGPPGQDGAPGKDGIGIAGKDGAHGKDAAQITIRGTYDAGARYGHLDAVATGGSTFIARYDNPGPCPGDGWQLIASGGRPGKPGPQGERGAGERGLLGRQDKRRSSWLGNIDFKNFRAFPVMSDKSTAPPIELRGFFEQYQELAEWPTSP